VPEGQARVAVEAQGAGGRVSPVEAEKVVVVWMDTDCAVGLSHVYFGHVGAWSEQGKGIVVRLHRKVQIVCKVVHRCPFLLREVCYDANFDRALLFAPDGCEVRRARRELVYAAGRELFCDSSRDSGLDPVGDRVVVNLEGGHTRR
jgi:hypothetical protein